MLNFPSLNFHLGETIDLLRATVQQFAADDIAPRAVAAHRADPNFATLVTTDLDLAFHCIAGR